MAPSWICRHLQTTEQLTHIAVETKKIDKLVTSHYKNILSGQDRGHTLHWRYRVTLTFSKSDQWLVVGFNERKSNKPYVQVGAAGLRENQLLTAFHSQISFSAAIFCLFKHPKMSQEEFDSAADTMKNKVEIDIKYRGETLQE